MRTAVLVSGEGTLLKAILEAGIEVCLVVSDRDCPALEIARKYGIRIESIERSFGPDFNRKFYSQRLVIELQQYRIELIVMAGFKTILDGLFFKHYPNQVLNSHPSLLPAFPGNNAVKAAMEYGVLVTGCTIHIATAEVDKGPILFQEAVRRLDGDTLKSLHERIKVAERTNYPRVIKEFITTLQASD